MSWSLPLTLALANIGLCDQFVSYDCSDPTSFEYIPHHKCRLPSGTIVKNEYRILQERNIKPVDGHQCSITITNIVSFCGAYSHTKETGESTYNVPQHVSAKRCKQMVETGSFSSHSMSFPIKIGGLNYINFFSKGSIETSGSNIFCQGEAMRLANGKVNNNMLRTHHVTIDVHKVHLTAVRGKVVHPDGQASVGPDTVDHGQFKSSMVIWDQIDPNSCNLLLVTEMELASVTPDVLFSSAHNVQFSVTNTFHDDRCKLMISQTDQKGIVLADKLQDIGLIHSIDIPNINVNAHYSSQLTFLSSKVRALLRTSFHDNTHPACSLIASTPSSTTALLAGSTFIRNLGDCSIKFDCKQIRVAPNISSECYSRLPVKDINGRIYYLDQSTRILMDHAAPSQCIPALLPTYRTDEGNMVVYSPDRRNIIINPEHEDMADDKVDSQGIFTNQMIVDWFSFAYIQSFVQNPYAYISKTLSDNHLDDHFDSLDFLQTQLLKLPTLTPPSFLLGFNIEYLGGICSIIVVTMVSVNTIIKVGIWMIKVFILQKEDVKFCSLLARVLCTDLYVITKIMINDKVKPKDEEKI